MPPPHTMPKAPRAQAAQPSHAIPTSPATSMRALASVMAAAETPASLAWAALGKPSRATASMSSAVTAARMRLMAIVAAPESVAAYRSYTTHCSHTRTAARPRKQAEKSGSCAATKRASLPSVRPRDAVPAPSAPVICAPLASLMRAFHGAALS